MADKEILDETLEEEGDIVVLRSSDGEEVEFEEIADVNLDGKLYLILAPIEKVEGMEEDEAIAFEVTEDEDGNDRFTIVTDDDTVDKIFAEYNRLFDEQDN